MARTAKGEETKTCSACQKVETRDISATGHKLGEWKQTKKPSCTVKGEEIKKCTVSGCTYSVKRDIKAMGHSYGKFVVTKEATETEDGIKTATCSNCGAT